MRNRWLAGIGLAGSLLLMGIAQAGVERVRLDVEGMT